MVCCWVYNWINIINTMIGLFFIGVPLTIIGFYIAYRIGSKNEME